VLAQTADRSSIARCLHNLANAAKMRGDFTRAPTALSEATSIFDEIGDLPVFEDIPYSSRRANHRLLPLAIDLSAKAINVHIHHVCVWLDAHAPHLV
jgi:hypothetical protein